VSYDLFFRSRFRNRAISRADFAGFFQGRPHYELEDSQAFYSNEDTGTYFAFDYSDPDGTPGDENGVDPSLLPVSFNLNYFRAHVFGLEAEPEVAAFVKRFDLLVSDPQMSGMGDGEYSRQGFLDGWNEGNQFGYRAIVSQDPAQKLLTLPAAQIEACWQWNLNRATRQGRLEFDGFVPLIFFFEAAGQVRTAVIWGDGLPILLPVVDLLLIPRERLAPRRWFRAKSDEVFFFWDELAPLIRRFPLVPGSPACYQLNYQTTPPELEQAIRNKQPPRDKPKGIPFDRILDRELIEKTAGG
jgi:hypothetical protein